MKKVALVVLIVVVGAFLLGLARLYRLRFESGDVYPPYSSYRADPLGTKALYASLGRLLEVRRYLREPLKLEGGRDRTLFVLGLQPEERDANKIELMAHEVRELESFAGDGGRVVLTLAPNPQRPRANRFQTSPPPRRSGSKEDRDREPPDVETIKLAERWEVHFDFSSLPTEEGRIQADAAWLEGEGDLPRQLSWHSALYFDRLSTNWHILYARTNERPVLVERRFGRGSIVLSTDSWLVSNEALLRERQPDLLSWLVGPAREVLFDETHFGVHEQPGVATLARRYRLHGLLFAVLALAALFVWKNAVSFVPPLATAAESENNRGFVQGRDSAAGFVNLLRRNIPSDQILKVCLEQWLAQFSHARKPSPAQLEQMQAIIDAENARPARQRDPVATYRKFCAVLARRRGGSA